MTGQEHAFLEHLNLFGTQVTEISLLELDLPNLNQLYVGQTGMTTKEIEQLRQKFSDAEIFGDVDLESVLQPTEDAKSNSTTFDPENNEK